MESLGHYLKVQRKLRGISLEAVSGSSKVAPNWLELLERDAFDKLPGEIFTKGYLRLYAEAVGLDPEDVILRYEVIAKKHEVAKLHPLKFWQRRDFWKAVVMLAGIAGILYWAISRFACAAQLTRHI